MIVALNKTFPTLSLDIPEIQAQPATLPVRKWQDVDSILENVDYSIVLDLIDIIPENNIFFKNSIPNFTVAALERLSQYGPNPVGIYLAFLRYLERMEFEQSAQQLRNLMP
jgi:hypothetical protein